MSGSVSNLQPVMCPAARRLRSAWGRCAAPRLILSLALLVALGLSGCSAAQVDGQEERTDSGMLTGLVLTDIRGESVAFSDYLGREVVLVSFWATFCKPCKSEMPFLQKLHETWGNRGLKVISISLDPPDTEDQVAPLIERNRYTFSVCIDRQSEATQLLNTKGVLPYLLIFDRSGKVVKKKDGFTVGDQPELEKLVASLLEPAAQ
ncbi:MAG: TlpA family protein disulfide reductase [Deltaproteobacteria bacterium]|nr:TlpA family protein disulfide reductase [Deltaproteobacteria bacterium]